MSYHLTLNDFMYMACWSAVGAAVVTGISAWTHWHTRKKLLEDRIAVEYPELKKYPYDFIDRWQRVPQCEACRFIPEPMAIIKEWEPWQDLVKAGCCPECGELASARLVVARAHYTVASMFSMTFKRWETKPKNISDAAFEALEELVENKEEAV